MVTRRTSSILSSAVISTATMLGAISAIGAFTWPFVEPIVAQQIERVAKPKFEDLSSRLRGIESSQQRIAEERARIDERLKTQQELLREQRDLSIRILQQLGRIQ